jgi:hypothetical protein
MPLTLLAFRLSCGQAVEAVVGRRSQGADAAPVPLGVVVDVAVRLVPAAQLGVGGHQVEHFVQAVPFEQLGQLGFPATGQRRADGNGEWARTVHSGSHGATPSDDRFWWVFPGGNALISTFIIPSFASDRQTR